MSRKPARSDLFHRTLRYHHVAMTRSFVTLCGGLLLGLMLSSCAKRAADNERVTSPESGGGAGSELDVLETELAARVERLRVIRLGLSDAAGEEVASAGSEPRGGADMAKSGDVPTTSSAPAAPSAERANEPAPGKCSEVCELSVSICQLQDQICGMVPRHEGEPRYAEACERAKGDCEFATEACHACG